MSRPDPASPHHDAAGRRRATMALAAALATLPWLPACASDMRANVQPVEVAVVDRDSGQLLTVYRKEGRAYVAGQPGARYAIRLRNQSAGRVLVVLSVDGVNVISGETAAYGQSGYVLEPGRSHDITGWRKTDTAIAAFEFAALSESYAARTGRPGNVGVIGAAVFLEQPVAPAVVPGSAREESGKALPAAPAADMAARSALGGRLTQGNERLGTAHGQREWSVSSRTTFERMSNGPQQLVEVAYDSRANLVAAGVIARPWAQALPRAFPNDDSRGFVPDPPAR